MNGNKITFWRRKFLSFIYEKKIRGNGIYTIEKYRILKVTLLKKMISYDEVNFTYLKFLHFTRKVSEKELLFKVNNRCFDVLDIPLAQDSLPLVSIIVPNYNHALYLRERLDSIYSQTYKKFEVILLDDASSDNSVEILTEYAQKYPQKTRLIVNEKNSGKVFAQWNKGLSLAKGEYIWIAESDDYCDKGFLKEVLLGLRHQSVMLSFARSVFMKDGKKIWSIERYLKDSSISWNAPFVMSAHMLVNKAFGIKNVVPNVSSAVFRNVGTIPDEITAIWKDMSLCGDWLFYLWLIRGGAVSYTNKVTNYYRIHENSTSLKVQDTLDYYIETFRVSCFVAQNYAVDLSIFDTVKNNLVRHCIDRKHENKVEEVERIYDLNQIKECAKCRRPNVAICGYSLIQGGGEVFPIYLANELKKQGIAVTFVDFRRANYDEGIRKKLDRDIPLIELSDVKFFNGVISALGTEIVHTHEGTVDYFVARVIRNKEGACKHIITLHGMYEAISKKNLDGILEFVIPSCSCFVYIADKNLLPFKGLFQNLQFRKIGNGLPQIPIVPHKRLELGIEENAFCLTLVSRAIFEKGWIEAIEAVKIARRKSERPIHLILIGEGECYDFLKGKNLPSYIHLLGRKSDVRNYFAMSDVGLLPSRFKGESFPLVVIESLMSGSPVVASDIGEVRNMLADEAGNMAGMLFKLREGEIPVDELAQIILLLATDNEKYMQLKRRTSEVTKKMNITHTAERYIGVYNEALNTLPKE